LRYQPNLLAASFRKGVTNTIGLVVMDIANPFYSELARGVEDLAYAQGFSIILCDSDVMEEREALYLEWLCSRRVDGILMTPINQDAVSRAILRERGVPYLLIDANDATDNASTVTIDHDKGAQMAVQHLLSLGHTRIAFVGGDLRIPPVRMMFAGFRRALNEAGLKHDPNWIYEESTEMHGGYVAMQKLLELRNRPTAALFISDFTAIAAMSALEERSLRVPEDFSIVGYDNIRMGALMKPPLTTVAQDQYQLGQISARILIHEIRSGQGEIHQRVMLQPRLVVRASTGR